MGDNPFNVYKNILGSKIPANEVAAGAKRAREGGQQRMNGNVPKPGPVRGPSTNPAVMAAVEAAKKRSAANLKKPK